MRWLGVDSINRPSVFKVFAFRDARDSLDEPEHAPLVMQRAAFMGCGINEACLLGYSLAMLLHHLAFRFNPPPNQAPFGVNLKLHQADGTLRAPEQNGAIV